MQPNYPSVAKPCTSSHSLSRSHFSQMENIKRTKHRKATILMDVAKAGLADFGHSRVTYPFLTRHWPTRCCHGVRNGGVCAWRKDTAKGENGPGFPWPYRFLSAAATIKGRNSWSLPPPSM